MPQSLSDSGDTRQDLGKCRWLTTIWLPIVMAVCMGVIAGCNPEIDNTGSSMPVTNSEPIEDFGSIQLTNAKGDSKSVSEWADGKHLVMIVSRGYIGTICPFCSAQAHDLAMNYDKIQAEGANLVLVFPVENKADGVKWEALQADALKETSLEKEGFPFPVVIDQGLAVVDRLRIRGQLAKPSTFILDSEGNLRFSYVGSDPGDRPSFGTILEELKQLN